MKRIGLLGLLFVVAIVLVFVGILAYAQLQSGDSLDGVTKVRYSGEPVTFTGCLGPEDSADYAEVRLIELASGLTVDATESRVVNRLFETTFNLPRVGYYVARARLCRDGAGPPGERCDAWIRSDDQPAGVQTCVPDGGNFVLALLAPPGAPEI